MQVIDKVLEKVLVVTFEVTSVSGMVTADLAPSDDKKVFTAGAVRYIDPAELKEFAAARQQANRACRNRGVRFLSGWAVPDESIKELVDELNLVAERVEAAKADLVGNWNEKLLSWQKLQPQVLPYVSRFPTAAHVEKQTGAKLSVYRILPTAGIVSAAEDGIQAEVDGLASRVLREIAQDVQDTWKPGAKASQRIKNLLSRLANKCRTLGFVGGNLGELACFIDEAIRRLPTEGAIQGADFAVLSGILSILSSPERMEATSKMIAESGLVATEPLFALAQPTEEGVAEDETSETVRVTTRVTTPSEAWSW